MNVSELERVLSLDDIVGNLWKLGRTPSEDEFQKFLLDNGLDGDEISDGLQGGNIPRVASLDLLRDLVMKNSASFQAGQCLASSEASKNRQERPISKSSETFSGPIPETKPTVSNNVETTATYQGINWKTLGEVGQNIYHSNPASAPTSNKSLSGSEDEDEEEYEAKTAEQKKNMTKEEIRRHRRMVSNRESARRSRRRKLEHVQCLDNQINQLKSENTALLEQLLGMEHRCRESMNENTKLKDELENLKLQLRQVCGKMNRSASMNRVSSQEHLAKRGRGQFVGEYYDQPSSPCRQQLDSTFMLHNNNHYDMKSVPFNVSTAVPGN